MKPPPDKLSRQQRRHIERELRKLIRHNVCSICGSSFKHNTCTASGLDAQGNVTLAGECCIEKVTESFGLGFVVGTDDKQLANIVRRSGVDCPLQANPPDGPWKDDDRSWFERNPKRSHRVRMPFPGEIDNVVVGTPVGRVLIMLVRQIEPGRRLRGAIAINADWLPLSDDEAVAHALFEVAVKREAAPPDSEALDALVQKYAMPGKPNQ